MPPKVSAPMVAARSATSSPSRSSCQAMTGANGRSRASARTPDSPMLVMPTARDGHPGVAAAASLSASKALRHSASASISVPSRADVPRRGGAPDAQHGAVVVVDHGLARRRADVETGERRHRSPAHCPNWMCMDMVAFDWISVKPRQEPTCRWSPRPNCSRRRRRERQRRRGLQRGHPRTRRGHRRGRPARGRTGDPAGQREHRRVPRLDCARSAPHWWRWPPTPGCRSACISTTSRRLTSGSRRPQPATRRSMVDGGALPYDRNVAVTAEATALLHGQGLAVEAELGYVGGKDSQVEQRPCPRRPHRPAAGGRIRRAPQALTRSPSRSAAHTP